MIEYKHKMVTVGNDDKKIRYTTVMKIFIDYAKSKTNETFQSKLLSNTDKSIIRDVVRIFIRMESSEFTKALMTNDRLTYSKYISLTPQNQIDLVLNAMDDLYGTFFKITYHYQTSHDTKSKKMNFDVRALDKARAQSKALKIYGGDIVITDTTERK